MTEPETQVLFQESLARLPGDPRSLARGMSQSLGPCHKDSGWEWHVGGKALSDGPQSIVLLTRGDLRGIFSGLP